MLYTVTDREDIVPPLLQVVMLGHKSDACKDETLKRFLWGNYNLYICEILNLYSEKLANLRFSKQLKWIKQGMYETFDFILLLIPFIGYLSPEMLLSSRI